MRPSCQKALLHHRRRYDRAYDSVIGVKKELVIERFLSGMRRGSKRRMVTFGSAASWSSAMTRLAARLGWNG